MNQLSLGGGCMLHANFPGRGGQTKILEFVGGRKSIKCLVISIIFTDLILIILCPADQHIAYKLPIIV